MFDHGGIYPQTAANSLVCACGIMVPQSACNEIERQYEELKKHYINTLEIAENMQSADTIHIIKLFKTLR